MPHTLLLADDSVTIQRVIELTFADEDIRVVSVGNGQQAIDRITADPPDIILADTGMPERDGYEVAAFVKQNPALAHIPVVLLTGAFEPVDGARAKLAGSDAVLVKPFEPQVVIRRVRELLGTVLAPAVQMVETEERAALEPEAEHGLPAGFVTRRRPVVSFETDHASKVDPPAPDTLAATPADAAADDDPLAAYLDRVDAALELLEQGDTRAERADEPAVAEPPQHTAPPDTPAAGSLESALSALEGALDNLGTWPESPVEDTQTDGVPETEEVPPPRPSFLSESDPIPVAALEPDVEPSSGPVWAPWREPAVEPISEPAWAPPFEPVFEPAFEPVFEPISGPTSVPAVESVPDAVAASPSEPSTSPDADLGPDVSLHALELALAAEAAAFPQEPLQADAVDAEQQTPLVVSLPAESEASTSRDVTVDVYDWAAEQLSEPTPELLRVAPPVDVPVAPQPEASGRDEDTDRPAEAVPPAEDAAEVESPFVWDSYPPTTVADASPPWTDQVFPAVGEPPLAAAVSELEGAVWSPPPPPEAPTPLPASPAPRRGAQPSLADAFASLLAAERGEARRARPTYPWPASSAPTRFDDDLVDQVTERVLARLSDGVRSELVSQIVTRVAERLVREEVDRQKK
ncbi:MAG: response regulator [Acidobacteria bacterium]|nr:response regulator [Acidobacteriota bacterium]